METDSKKYLFEEMPVPKAITTMAVPTIISQLINLIYSLVDTFFIGRTGNSYMMAAVTLAFTLFMMDVAFANLFGIGGGSLVARLLGSGKNQNAKSVCAYSFYGSIAIAFAYSILVGVLLNPILRLFGASELTIGYARQYVILVVIIGNLPVILSGVCAHLLRNVGYSNQASIGLSGGGILNIILDPLFMFVILPDGWEVFGAALATLISNIASAIYLLWALKKVSKISSLSISLKDARQIEREDKMGIFRVGVPSAILTGLFDVANIVLNALMAIHGDLQLAAVGIVMKAERLPGAFNVGICQGMLPIVAYNFSSGNRDRMKKVMNTVRNYGLVVSGICLIIFEVFASPIVKIFLNTSAENATEAIATIGFAAAFLRFRVIASPFQFLNFHTSYCMQAMGNGRDTLIHAIVREIVFYIPLMYILNFAFGANGLVAALCVGEAMAAVFAMLLLKRWLNKIHLQNL